MDFNLAQVKSSEELDLGFYRQLQDFLFSYLKTTRSYWLIHGDIKPRLAIKSILNFNFDAKPRYNSYYPQEKNDENINHYKVLYFLYTLLT